MAERTGSLLPSPSAALLAVQRCTEKVFPCPVCPCQGCDGDSQSQGLSATLHVSITFCCPSACLAGLADVNKRVSPFLTWAPWVAGPVCTMGREGGMGWAQNTL